MFGASLNSDGSGISSSKQLAGDPVSPAKSLFLTKSQKMKKNGVTVYKCLYGKCGKMFPTKHKIERHLRVHSGDKPYHCRFCDFKSARKDSVQCHESRLHGFVESKFVTLYDEMCEEK